MYIIGAVSHLMKTKLKKNSPIYNRCSQSCPITVMKKKVEEKLKHIQTHFNKIG